jgi:hypothetical protein
LVLTQFDLRVEHVAQVTVTRLARYSARLLINEHVARGKWHI